MMAKLRVGLTSLTSEPLFLQISQKDIRFHLSCLQSGNKPAPSQFLSADRGGKEDPGEKNMRSDLVFGALAQISNRYHLCRLTSKGTRKLHVRKARLQETTNDVLVRLRHSQPIPLITLQSAHFQRRPA
jgi:hypothetical protein